MISSRIKSVVKAWMSRYQSLHLEYPVDMRPRYGHGLPAHPLLHSIIQKNRDIYTEWLEKARSCTDEIALIPDAEMVRDPGSPSWNNGFLPGLDMVILYTLIAHMEPTTYVEIGSGHSTKVVALAKKNRQLVTRMISIDPSPRAEIDMLADEIVRAPFEETDLHFFKKLNAGDIVFVDNSHRIFPNSDATVFFLEVLPFLPEGVVVHLHDIYLPYDYPQFMCDRYYSEQYPLACYLMANPERYQTLMPNYYISEDPELKKILQPLWEHPSMPVVEQHGASFWLRIGK